MGLSMTVGECSHRLAALVGITTSEAIKIMKMGLRKEGTQECVCVCVRRVSSRVCENGDPVRSQKNMISLSSVSFAFSSGGLGKVKKKPTTPLRSADDFPDSTYLYPYVPTDIRTRTPHTNQTITLPDARLMSTWKEGLVGRLPRRVDNVSGERSMRPLDD